MKTNIHPDVVTNYAIDNAVSLEQAYVDVIDTKLALLENECATLRRDVEFTMEAAQ